jgi:hypothetical protein
MSRRYPESLQLFAALTSRPSPQLVGWIWIRPGFRPPRLAAGLHCRRNPSRCRHALEDALVGVSSERGYCGCFGLE